MNVTQQSGSHPDVSAVDDDRALISLASAFALAQLALHLWGALSTRDLQTSVMHAIALIYDLFLLAIAVVALRSLLRRCGDRAEGKPDPADSRRPVPSGNRQFRSLPEKSLNKGFRTEKSLWCHLAGTSDCFLWLRGTAQK